MREKTSKLFVRINLSKFQSTAEPWPLSQDSLKFPVEFTMRLMPDLSFQWNGKRRFCFGTRAVTILTNGKRTCTLKRFSEEHLGTFTKWWNVVIRCSCSHLLRLLWNTSWSSLSLWPDWVIILSWLTCLRTRSWEEKRLKLTQIRNSFHWSRCSTKSGIRFQLITSSDRRLSTWKSWWMNKNLSSQNHFSQWNSPQTP